MLEIQLSEPLNTEQQQALASYLAAPHTLMRAEWTIIWHVMDVLRTADVSVGDQHLTFAEFYRVNIDDVYADTFLNALWDAEQPEVVGKQLKISTSNTIRQHFRAQGWYTPTKKESRGLFAHCVYWWNSFANGYIFEVSVLKELQKAGIVRAVRDIRNRDERFASADILIGEWTGDVKNSTCFFFVARSYPLLCDFYITRLFNAESRQHDWIVLLNTGMWTKIDGETKASDFHHLDDCLEAPLHFELFGNLFIAISYGTWKQKLSRYQQGDTTDENENIGYDE